MKYIKLIILILFIPISYSFGLDWKLMGQPTDGYIRTIGCHDSNSCYIISSGTFLTEINVSNDQGKSWGKKYSRDFRDSEPPIVINNWGGISPSAAHYYIIYWDRDEIHKSIDSGKTFKRIELFDGIRNLDKNLAMRDTNVGMITAKNHHYVTFDGWDTFEVRDTNRFKNYRHLEFISDSIVRGLASNYRSEIKYTGSRIVNYNIYTDEIVEIFKFIPPKNQVYADGYEDMSIVSDSVSYVSGDRVLGLGSLRYDLVAKTTDGGKTWEKILDNEIESKSGTMAISFYDENNGFIIAQGGKIILTNDGGKTWKYETPEQESMGEKDRPRIVSTSVIWAGRTPIIASSRGYIYRYEGDYFVFDGKYKGTLSISGRVLNNGIGQEGVSLFNGEVYTTTDAEGYYEFPNLEEGTYRITPVDLDYTYAPEEATIKLTENKTNIDFVATPTNRFYSVSGRVTLNGKGVYRAYVEADDYLVLTDSNGYYEIGKVARNDAGFPSVKPQYAMSAYDNDYTYTPKYPTLVLVSDTTGIDFSLDVETSVEIPEPSNFYIYPNPTSDYLHISNSNQLTKVEIYSIDSKLIMTAYSNLDRIDVGFLQSGSYVIKLTDINNIITSHKFIKK